MYLDTKYHSGLTAQEDTMLYVKEHIPCRMLSKFTFEAFEAFAIEINLRRVKWLLVCSYNPNYSNLPVHLNAIDKAIEFYSKTYDKISIAGEVV